MKKLIYLSLVLLIATSCSTKRKIDLCEKWNVYNKDTLIETHTEILKDTVIKTETSQAVMDLLFECDSLGQVFVKNINNLSTENTNLKLKLKDGHFIAYVEVPRDSIVIQYKEIIKTKKEVVTQKVNHLTDWQKFRLRTWYVLAAIIIIIIIYKVKKLLTL